MTATTLGLRRFASVFPAILFLHLPLLISLGSLPVDSGMPGRGDGAGTDEITVLEVVLVPAAPAVAPVVSSPESASTPPSAAGARPRSTGGRGSGGYLARVRARLESVRRPLETPARGTAILAFRVDAAGQIDRLRLERSSGDARLDEEALALLRRAAPLPSPPDGQPLGLSVPVLFE